MAPTTRKTSTARKTPRDVAIVDQANLGKNLVDGGIDPAVTDLGSALPPPRDTDVITADVVDMMMKNVGGSGTKMF